MKDLVSYWILVRQERKHHQAILRYKRIIKKLKNKQ